ncbi:MAG: hypothetical protein SFW09_14665 [Hyphomicrobiaceae bacterium]|nr:hypothetical protein [Hyphomicrobiaceae bacterium]
MAATALNSAAVAAMASPALPLPTHVDARYLVQGPADPGLLPRLVEPFAKLGTVPTRVHASREAGDGSEMTVDLRLAQATPRTAQLIEHALRRVVGVRQLIAVMEPAT